MHDTPRGRSGRRLVHPGRPWSSLQDLQSIGGNLVITDNPLLPDAEVTEFIDAIGKPNIDGIVTAENNGG